MPTKRSPGNCHKEEIDGGQNTLLEQYLRAPDGYHSAFAGSASSTIFNPSVSPDR